MRSKSILTEAKQISRAVALIGLGARLQVLESETDLSYERLLRLYKEVAGKSPSKGQLPFSTDWFMTWQPNIHASLFLNIHEYLNKSSELDEIDAVIKGYQLYQEETSAQGLEPLLVGDPRLAPGQVRRQRHADHDEVLEVRRPVRDPSARDRPTLPVRPVQPAGACRQGQGGRRDPHALIPDSSGRLLKSPAGLSKDRALCFIVLACLLQHDTRALNAGPSGPAFLFRPGFPPTCGDRPRARRPTLKRTTAPADNWHGPAHRHPAARTLESPWSF